MSGNLKAANNYRRVRKQCMPLFDLASGKDWNSQCSVYHTMVHLIGQTLGVEVSEHDLSIPAQLPSADHKGWQVLWDEVNAPLVSYDHRVWGFSVSPAFDKAAA